MIFFIELLLFVFLGISFGILTGLTPGVHINLVSTILLSISPILLQYVHTITLASFIIAMAITHTFLDFIPSVYLGCPNEATALSVLPGHRFLLEGMGYEAVRISIIGSVLGIIFVLCMTPLFLFIVPLVFLKLKDLIVFILIIIILYMLFKSKDKNIIFWSVILFSFSGILGIITFSFSLKDPLFPLFSGMFGVSVLLTSISEEVIIPTQRTTEQVFLPKMKIIWASIVGSFSGCLLTLFPGLGPAQAGAFGSQFISESDESSYLILTGAIGSASMLFSLITLFTIDKARNGVIVAIQQLGLGVKEMSVNGVGSSSANNILLILLVSAAIAACIAIFLSFYFAKIFSAMMNKINYQFLCFGIIVFITLLVFVFTGFTGILILFTSTCLGLLPQFLNIPRSTLMGCLLLSVVLYGI